MPFHPPKFPTDTHGWQELLTPRISTRELTGTHKYKWVIVGAGLTGLSCAYRLAELHPSEKILLLDARKVGQGASGRNAGFAIAASHFPGGFDRKNMSLYQRVRRINQTGLSLLRTLTKKNNIKCDWDENGFHHLAADKKALGEHAHYRACLEALQIPHTQFYHQMKLPTGLAPIIIAPVSTCLKGRLFNPQPLFMAWLTICPKM